MVNGYRIYTYGELSASEYKRAIQQYRKSKRTVDEAFKVLFNQGVLGAIVVVGLMLSGKVVLTFTRKDTGLFYKFWQRLESHFDRADKAVEGMDKSIEGMNKSIDRLATASQQMTKFSEEHTVHLKRMNGLSEESNTQLGTMSQQLGRIEKEVSK